MKTPRRIEPGPGQESVWDYPRPPRMEKVTERIHVEFGGLTIADTTAAYRILETSHPPTYYLPPQDVRQYLLTPARRESLCEWKGRARYLHIESEGRRAENAAWTYPDPVPAFADLKDHIAFFAHAMDACFVGDQRVQPQPGDFYGGWVTAGIVGPFKGPAGTWHW